MDIDVNRILEVAVALITSGTLAGAVVFLGNTWRKAKAAWKENDDLKGKFNSLLDVGVESLSEGEHLAKQLLALSKAADDSDKALARVSSNEALRKSLLEAAAKFSEDEQRSLAQLLTPVKAGIREYAGLETDKLTVLKEAMEKNLDTQETRNRIMVNSGKMARMIAEMGIKSLPYVAKK